MGGSPCSICYGCPACRPDNYDQQYLDYITNRENKFHGAPEQQREAFSAKLDMRGGYSKRSLQSAMDRELKMAEHLHSQQEEEEEKQRTDAAEVRMFVARSTRSAEVWDEEEESDYEDEDP